jgi:drug/metabolite transporter (DMT)-like permease
MMAASYRPRVWLALATIYIVWGSTFMAVTIAVRDVPPLLAMGIRHVTAGTLLLAWAFPRGDRQGDPIGWTQIRAGLATAASRGRSRPCRREWRRS